MSQVYPTQVYSKQQLDKFVVELSKTQNPARIKFLFKLPMYANVAEIGVTEGNFSKCILKVSKPKNLYLIDHWHHQRSGSFLQDPMNADQKEQDRRYKLVKKRFGKHTNAKILREYSLDAARSFPKHYFDWIYLDANHAYENVKEDLKAWYPKVKKSGILSGHDYTYKDLFEIGVIPAVDEFIKKHDMEMFLIDSDPWHSWAVQRKVKRDTFVSRVNFLNTQLKRKTAKSRNYEKIVALSTVLRNKVTSIFNKS